ncbi:hypothetical protein DIC66_15545 [Rhodoferax lacus]|uniref:Uncharacterized protein n=1 Tax=Rhodoferax lacus TaxID=2184758 RepID=A0A3E1R908_9BURK|nr:hypothetical protein [Rhodoferax lacus]RFO95859.1 hypothetical protein DIC66_15545 [Rhodoferax lacus]
MRSEVNVTVEGQAFSFSLEGREVLANEVARNWLDAQFVELECEPIRASGKLLLADKVVAIAREAGARRFADAAWGTAFAAAASAALGKKTVLVDADALSVTY